MLAQPLQIGCGYADHSTSVIPLRRMSVTLKVADGLHAHSGSDPDWIWSTLSLAPKATKELHMSFPKLTCTGVCSIHSAHLILATIFPEASGSGLLLPYSHRVA